MTKATVYNVKGEKVKDIELNPKVFGLKINPELVTHAVNVQTSNARNVLAHAKGRSEVAGGGKKPWRQKGTGRARHGSIRSPLWKGGGVTFGPTSDRNFSLKINRKAKKKAILMGLSDKAVNEKVILLDALVIDEARTKKFYEILQNLKLRSAKVKASAKKTGAKEDKKEDKKESAGSGKEDRVLVVIPKNDEKLIRAVRNISKAETIAADSLNIVDILKAKYLVVPVASIEVIEKTFVK